MGVCVCVCVCVCGGKTRQMMLFPLQGVETWVVLKGKVGAHTCACVFVCVFVHMCAEFLFYFFCECVCVLVLPCFCFFFFFLFFCFFFLCVNRRPILCDFVCKCVCHSFADKIFYGTDCSHSHLFLPFFSPRDSSNSPTFCVARFRPFGKPQRRVLDQKNL